MSELVLPKIDKATIDKKEYIFKNLAKIINPENVLSHADEIKPYELLSICKSIEVKLGRKKAAKNSPRVCDIDIIDFNGLILNDKLNLPHKMMHKRSFVLFPLFEIEKNWVHPIKKTNIKKLILSLSNKDIRSIKQI